MFHSEGLQGIHVFPFLGTLLKIFRYLKVPPFVGVDFGGFIVVFLIFSCNIHIYFLKTLQASSWKRKRRRKKENPTTTASCQKRDAYQLCWETMETSKSAYRP